jgi:hypothetical protein
MINRIRLSSGPSSSQSPVRGRPFKDGNPGRPPGSKNKITRLLEDLLENDGEDLIRKHIELAKGGNVRCLQYCLDRLLPQRRGQPINLQLPKINSAQDVATAMAAISDGVSSGNVTAEEALHLARVLETYTNAIIANDFAVRLQKVEAAVNKQDLR